MSPMTKKEKDAIIAKGEADAKAKAEAEEAEKEKADSEEEEDAEIIDDESDEEAESDEDSEEDVDIDYEEIAKKETERANAAEEARKKAEDALAEKNFKKRKDKREGKDEDDDSDEDKPLTRRELASLLAEQEQRTLSKTQEADALRIARENTSSEKEAQAALLFYRNRIKPTGNLEEDVLFAIGGLNRKKVVAEKSEVVRTLKSKENSSKSFAATHRSGSSAEKGKITSRDAEAIKASGMVWDQVKRVYKKPIGNGKTFFYYDPKSKKRWKGK